MKTSTDYENFYTYAGPEGILMAAFTNPELKTLYTGKTISQIAANLSLSPEDTIFKLVLEDTAYSEAIYFFVNKENLKKVSLKHMPGRNKPHEFFLKPPILQPLLVEKFYSKKNKKKNIILFYY